MNCLRKHWNRCPLNDVALGAKSTTVALVLAIMSSGALAVPPEDSDSNGTPAACTADRNPARAACPAPWWLALNDATLNELVTSALRGSPSMRTARAVLSQARAQVDAQGATLLPAVNLSASAGGVQASGARWNNQNSGTVSAMFQPDLFGGNRSGAAVLNFEALASAEALDAAASALATTVALSYVQLRGLQAQIEMAKSTLALEQKLSQITRWRVQSGLSSAADEVQALSSLEQATARIPELVASAEQAQHALATLTGQEPKALNQLLSPPRPVPRTSSVSSYRTLEVPIEALRSRPDIRAAEHRITAASARVSVAEAARYPKFSLNGSLNLSSLSLALATHGGSLVSTFLGGLSVPVFDGGAAEAQTRSQEAALEQARANYQSVVLGALRELADIVSALAAYQDRIPHLQLAAQAASSAAKMAEFRYSSGSGDLQMVLLARRADLSAQDLQISTQVQFSLNQVRLAQALAGT